MKLLNKFNEYGPEIFMATILIAFIAIIAIFIRMSYVQQQTIKSYHLQGYTDIDLYHDDFKIKYFCNRISMKDCVCFEGDNLDQQVKCPFKIEWNL